MNHSDNSNDENLKKEDLNAILNDALNIFQNVESKTCVQDSSNTTLSAKQQEEKSKDKDDNSEYLKLLENFQKACLESGTLDDDENQEKKLKEAAFNLMKGSENLNDEIIDENKFEELYEKITLSLDEDMLNSDNPFQDITLIQDFMKVIVSKEFFYPHLKKVSEKYPEWLLKNKANIDKEKFDNFTKQKALIEKICSVYEQESDGKNKEDEDKRFNEILTYMEQIQVYGPPPKELIS